MFADILVFLVALVAVTKGSTLATTHASKLANVFRLSKYAVGFIIVAVISILPETFISITSALQGVPSFGLGMLLGSNIADLTLVFAIIVFVSGKSLKVEGSILKGRYLYPLLLLLPLALGLDGYYSRPEGVILIIAGAVYNYLALTSEVDDFVVTDVKGTPIRSVLLLLLSMALLLAGAHFVVASATDIAVRLGVSPILIGMLVVGLGTTLPELFFSLRSVKEKEYSLAIGNVLGTVLADATLVVGILAVLHPFPFPKKIVYVTGTFMVVASLVLFHFMRTGRTISKREARLLFAFWVTFVITEFLVNT